MLYGALAFAITVAFIPGIEGGATTPRWALIAFVVPWLLRDRHRFSVADLAAGLFLVWSSLTLWWSPAVLDGIGELLILVLLFSCFWLGHQITDMRPVWIGAGLGIAVSSAIALAQSLGLPLIVGERTTTAALFANGNFMAEAAALVLVAALVERIWWLVPLLLPAFLLPLQRGSLLAAALALGVYVFGRPRAIVVAAFMGIVLLLVAVAGKNPASIDMRLDAWRAALSHLSFFGHGLGVGALVVPPYLHNEFLNVAFETGLPGVLLLALLCLPLFGPLNAARCVLVAFAVEACFAYPLHLPVTGFLASIAAGFALRDWLVLWSFHPLRRVPSEDRMAVAVGDYPYLGRASVPVRSSLSRIPTEAR